MAFFTALPQMGGALSNWQQLMTFTTVAKTIVNSKVVETKTDINFRGVWQPMSPQDLMMKPSGQRSWKWYTCHALPEVQLNPDEIITYNSESYRIMKKSDYKEYGYIEYHLVQDYVGGP